MWRLIGLVVALVEPGGGFSVAVSKGRPAQTVEDWVPKLKSLVESAPLTKHGEAEYRGRVEILLAKEKGVSCEPLAWLRGQKPGKSRVFFAAPEFRGGACIAGYGACQVVSGAGGAEAANEVFESALNLPSGAKFVGGGRFDANSLVSPEWKNFKGHCFVLPAVCLERREGETTAACNLLGSSPEEAVRKALASLDEVVAEPAPEPPRAKRCESFGIVPAESEWTRLVQDGLDAIKCGKIDKVVPARREECDASSALDTLRRLEQYTPHQRDSCYRFYLEPPGSRGGDEAFAGCSPELLFSVDSNAVSCDVLAGTRRRSPHAETDDALRRDLLESDKDALENDIVGAFIKRQFAEMFDGGGDGRVSMHLSDVQILDLADVRHLRRTLRCELPRPRENDVVRRLLASLHPTPATLGQPSTAARSFLAERAGYFDRGWYAGPFGTVESDEADFCVAIRSALFKRHRTYVYAGAGVVKGSDPYAEADEIDLKLYPLKAALRPQQRIVGSSTASSQNAELLLTTPRMVTKNNITVTSR